MAKQGYLLINLGTPAAPTTKAVKSYLKTFLMDGRVIALPHLIRFILVYGIIAPFRSHKTAHAYQAIWTKEGSPLRIHTQELTQKLEQKHGSKYKIRFAMRYSEPTIAEALNELSDCENIGIVPLYPQYASATNGSSIMAIFDYFKNKEIIPNLSIIRDFYEHPAYMQALTESIRPYLKPNSHLLMSYHGLPENQLQKIGCNPVCTIPCPSKITPGKACYRQQCFLTSKALANNLGLTEDQYTISFQSRLGKTPWIKPYTDEVLQELAAQGIKNLCVVCPAFVADCLETLEEIEIQAKEQWQALGGHDFQYIPCLNAQDHWVTALAQILDL